MSILVSYIRALPSYPRISQYDLALIKIAPICLHESRTPADIIVQWQMLLFYASVSSMNVSLTRKLERWIASEVKEGKYQTASEVICDAVRQLVEREEALKRLRIEIDKGLKDIERGRVMTFDMKQIKAEGRKRLAERKRRDARHKKRNNVTELR